MGTTVGTRVREERERQEVKRADLAKAAGISVSTLSDLELDRSQSTTKLHRIAQRLGLRTEWLETGQGPKTASAVHEMPDKAELRPELVINRLQNDIKALHFALNGIVSAMVAHRPAEALDAARAIRKLVPAKFRDQGYAHELAVTLESAQRQGTSGREVVRGGVKPRSSRKGQP